MNQLFNSLLLACLFFTGTIAAMADALVVNQSMQASTILEAFVEEKSLRVEIEVSLSDVPAFADLLPDELYEKLGNPPQPHPDRIKRFFSEGLAFQADGKLLEGRLKSIEPGIKTRRDPVSGEPLPAADGEEPEKTLFMILEYPLETKPKKVTFAALPRLPEGGSIAVGFVLYHLGVAMNDFRYCIAGSVADLDWADPWHSRFEIRTMRRTYDSPLNVFLYAEPYEVRVEVVVRPLDLQPFVDLGLDGQDSILPENYATIKERTAEFLAKNYQLEVDGELVEPVLDRIHFLRRTLKSSTVIDPPEELNAFIAQLGVIYIVPRTGLPKEAKLTWNFFPKKIEAIPGSATDEAGSLPTSISREDPTMVWTNFLKKPTDVSRKPVKSPPAPQLGWLRPSGFALLVIGAFLLAAAARNSIRRKRPAWVVIGTALIFLGGSFQLLRTSGEVTIDENQSKEIVGTLLYNIYRSFDFHQEEAVYDMLSTSVAGPMLESTYLETRRGLVLKNQGGARAKVNMVELEEISPEPLEGRQGFRAEVDWIVGGSVGHWGHLHQRQNRYKADITVETVDEVWKITGMDVSSEERIQ